MSNLSVLSDLSVLMTMTTMVTIMIMMTMMAMTTTTTMRPCRHAGCYLLMWPSSSLSLTKQVFLLEKRRRGSCTGWYCIGLLLAGCSPKVVLKNAKKNSHRKYKQHKKTSQELRMLSRSLSDCKSLTLHVMIQVSQFVIVNCVTKSQIALNRSQSKSLSL